MDEKDKLEILRDILFTEDREYAEKITERLEQIEQAVNSNEVLASKVGPIVKTELDDFSKKLPETITAALQEEIENHQDKVVDVLFPILGRMIKKYIAQEIRLLSEKINSQLGFKSPIKSVKRKFTSWFGGIKEEDLILSDLSSAKIEQVLFIEKGSGILKASYSETKTIDEDMVSGMLTAIKIFVEDAFGQKNQNLELIEYELYHIHLQSFLEYYIAVVVSGNYSLKSKTKIQDVIFNFYDNFMKMSESEQQNINKVEKELELNFGDASI